MFAKSYLHSYALVFSFVENQHLFSDEALTEVHEYNLQIVKMCKNHKRSGSSSPKAQLQLQRCGNGPVWSPLDSFNVHPLTPLDGHKYPEIPG